MSECCTHGHARNQCPKPLCDYHDRRKPCPDCTKHLERLTQWARDTGFSTGHADSVEELLGEVGEQVESLRTRIRYLENLRGQQYDDMLLRRGIDRAGGDEPCKACSGAGVRAYGSTTTWRGGMGGQMMTSDICDKCWGSGRADEPWLNLRKARK